MKVKLLLCMMVLGLLGTAAQPRVTDNGLIKMPTPFPVLTKTINTESPTTPKRATKAKAGAVTHQVDFVLDFDPETQIAFGIQLNNNEYEIINNDGELNEVYELVNGSNILNVPEGTYDILVTFQQVDWSQEMFALYKMRVIREQVTIDRDMQLNFASSEAKNHIHFETLTPDGEPVNMGKWSVDDEYINWTELEPGNTDYFFFLQNIYCEDYGLLNLNAGNFEITIEQGPHYRTGHEYIGDFFVNDVSDRYTFNTYRVGSKGQNLFTTAYEVKGASGDVTLTNDPSKYILFQEPMIAQKHQDENLCLAYIMYAQLPFEANVADRLSVTLPTPLAKDEVLKCYISASIDDSQIGFIPFLEPSVGRLVTETTPWGWEQQQYKPALACMRLTNTNGEVVFANNGVASVLTRDRTAPFGPNFQFEYNESLGRVVSYPLWPTFNPPFSYSVEKKIGNLGNDCPLLIVDAMLLEEDDGSRALVFQKDYLGRYGEKKVEDASDAQVQIYANGEYYGSAEAGVNSIYLGEGELTSGEADIYITNSDETVTVDDMACSNKAQMHIVIGGEDQSSPTATMLHFKNGNDDVTDRFDTAHDGTLEFSAGDFNRRHFFDAEGHFFVTYDRYAPETVEVSYSPYGEDNWNELAVEEVPENYWPVMGWFYTGSLAGVTGEALNGWFDLKIRLTDAAGNWQEQVLSPAFRIDDLAYSSVANVGKDNAREVARYSIDGKRVDSNATGIVIIKMSDGTAKKVIL